MKLTLRRTSLSRLGIFGLLLGQDGAIICYTLEHSYGGVAKVPMGEYECQRGSHHKLAHSLHPFETFEVLGVPGHTGILFHCGNDQDDSDGCILVGSDVSGLALVASRLAFARFLSVLTGVDKFSLVVK